MHARYQSYHILLSEERSDIYMVYFFWFHDHIHVRRGRILVIVQTVTLSQTAGCYTRATDFAQEPASAFLQKNPYLTYKQEHTSYLAPYMLDQQSNKH